MKYKTQDYEELDPLEGDFDVEVKNRAQKIVKCRKPHICWGGCGNQIKQGESAVNLSGFIDSEPISFYYCIPCFDSWLDEFSEHDDEGEDA